MNESGNPSDHLTESKFAPEPSVSTMEPSKTVTEVITAVEVFAKDKVGNETPPSHQKQINEPKNSQVSPNKETPKKVGVSYIVFEDG
jgi:hypothetical protein